MITLISFNRDKSSKPAPVDNLPSKTGRPSGRGRGNGPSKSKNK